MFGKYEFDTEKQAGEYIDLLKDVKCAIVVLGNIVIQPEELYKNGKVKTASILNEGYSVDVLWGDLEPEIWSMKRITLGKNKSSHEFAGSKYYESL